MVSSLDSSAVEAKKSHILSSLLWIVSSDNIRAFPQVGKVRGVNPLLSTLDFSLEPFSSSHCEV